MRQKIFNSLKAQLTTKKEDYKPQLRISKTVEVERVSFNETFENAYQELTKVKLNK